MHSDTEPINNVLKKGKLNVERLVVDTKDKFIKALTTFSPDIVLSDNSHPSLNSHEARAILSETQIKIPVILIADIIPDDSNIDIIKRGADDYILKDGLNRLPTVIHNALEKFRLEKERQTFLNELIKKEKHYRALIENSTDGMVILSAENKAIYVSPSVNKILGYTVKEIMELDLFTICHADDIPELGKPCRQSWKIPVCQ